jgi:PEP-CTERM motif-containing protein
MRWEVNMVKIFSLVMGIFLTALISRAAFADMVSFDFDDIQSQSKKGPNASDVEAYMEALFGDNVSVSQNTGVGKAGASLLQGSSSSLGISDGYLKIGKGKGSGITLDFSANPIDSFSVDWLLQKGGKNFTILADGIVINQQTLSKAQKKSGAAGHQGAYFFDSPIHKLQFLGTKKKFAIDNLVINIPLPGDDGGFELWAPPLFPYGDPNENVDDPNENGGLPENILPINVLDNPGGDGINQTASVPEPASWMMLVLGLCGAWASRRIVAS